MTGLFVLLLVFAACCGLAALIRQYAIRRQLIDVPGWRSSHSDPTPRGGGLAIVIVFALVSGYWFYAAAIDGSAAAAVVAGGILVAAIGFRDDHRDTSIRLRLAVHAVSVTVAVFLVGGLPSIPLGSLALDLGLFGSFIGIVAIVWLLNLYNFMDGIDGMAAAEAITTSLGGSLILLVIGQTEMALWLLSLAAASAGFLAWNWPPAKLFMGDVGSGFLGYVLGVFALITSHESGLNLWVWLILLAVFVADATVTLVRRISGGEIWYEAHASHAYQHAARRWASHKKVTVAVACINICWLFPIAMGAALAPHWAATLTVLAYTPVLWLVLRFRAGVTEADDTVCVSH